MKTRLVLFMAIAVLLLSATPLLAQENNQHPLVEILALIPDTPEVRAYGVSYMDYAGIVAARPGTPEITSWAQFDRLDNSSDDADQDALGLWMAAIMGIASGPPDLPQSLFSARDAMAEVVGFSFFDIERGATFLPPPETVSLLQGNFDLEAIANAFSDRGYTAEGLPDMTLLCGPDGCENGMAVDFANINPANPFGGHLGRSQPLLYWPGAVISSPSDAILNVYPALLDGSSPTLADAPDVQAAARAIMPMGALIQAHFYDPSAFPPADPTLALLATDMTAEERDDAIENLRAQIEAGAQSTLPYYSLVAFADLVDDDEQVTVIGLVFENAKTAQIAAQVLSARISEYQSLVLRQSFMEILAERDIRMGAPELVGDWDTGLVVVLIPFRAPMPPQEPNDSVPQFVQSSMVFHLFVNMLYRRDLSWLGVGE